MLIDLKSHNHPFDEVIQKADELARNGALCFQKWTCAGCGQRLMSDHPNVFTETGHCKHCNHITDLRATGCNYLLMMAASRVGHAPT